MPMTATPAATERPTMEPVPRPGSSSSGFWSDLSVVEVVGAVAVPLVVVLESVVM